MDRGSAYSRLLDDAMRGKISRRGVLRRGALLGLSAPAIASILAACGGEEETPTTTGGATGSPTARATASPGGGRATATVGGGAYSMDSPPPVANAEAASQYSGQSITYYGDTVGVGAQMDQALASRFTQDTGIQVNIIPKPQSATENYSTYQRLFQGQSADVDVMMLDVIWPGAFAPHLLDLTDALGNEAQQHYESIIQNNTVDGRLIAMPWFGDFGMLFYRTDLLDKYGYDAPPQTWEELQQMAQEIMTGEQSSRAEFSGFVFQGSAYEGLTCNGLEWIASTGGGTIMDGTQVTLDNPQAVAILNQARGWIGAIAPRGVTSYQEEDARNVFQGGNAAFMRNWPYAYAAGNASDSPIQGMFDVAPLPAGEGEDHVGTLGGWQLGVSAYSRAPEAATEFVRYMTGPDVQTWRAVLGSYVPTIPAVATQPDVIAAMPFLESLRDVVRVPRPSSQTGERYNEVSTRFFQGVSQILNGQDAAQVVPQIVQQIERVIG